MALQNIGPVGNFPVNKGVCVELGGRRIAVFNVTGQYYAIDDTCPHRGGSFSSGSVQGLTAFCPLHGAGADVRTGACSPPSPRAVAVHDVSCDGQQLFVDL